MDKSESFMNWGFNPTLGGNPTPYYLVFGGAGEDMDAWCGMAKFSKLEDALIQLFDCWDDWTPWVFDDLGAYIQAGDEVNLRNDNGRTVEAYLNNLYFLRDKDHKPLFESTPQSFLINPKIEKNKIKIRNLVELSPLRDGEPPQEYVGRVKKEYKDYIKNSPVIQDYRKNLDSLAKQKKRMCNTKWQVNMHNAYHNNFIICEMKHWIETSGNTWKLVFSP